MLFSLEKEDLFCFYDKVKRLAVISFQNSTSPEKQQAVKSWLESLTATQLPFIGILCDLRTVRQINPMSLFFEATQDLPLAIIIMHPYQARNIHSADNGKTNYRIQQSYEAAFKFLAGSLDDPQNPLILNSEGASEYYDTEKNLVCVNYYGLITPIVTADVYNIGARMIEQYGLPNLRGMIADFRHVVDFDNSNLNAVRRTSGNLNMNYDMSHVAAALLVATMIQEKMVHMSMKITPQEERKRVVHSLKEAYLFVDEFHAHRLGKATK
jgi:hypothetical protein